MLRVIRTVKPRWIIGENVPGIIKMALDEVLADLENENYRCQTYLIPACGIDAHHKRERVWIVGHAQHAGQTTTEIKGGAAQGSHHSEAESEQASEFERSGSGAGGAELLADTDKGRGGNHQGRGLAGISENTNEQAVPEGERETFSTNAEHRCKTLADTIGKRGRLRNPQWQDAEDVGKPSSYQGYDSRGVAKWNPEPSVGRVANGVSNRVDRVKSLGNSIVPGVSQIIAENILKEEEKWQR